MPKSIEGYGLCALRLTTNVGPRIVQKPGKWCLDKHPRAKGKSWTTMVQPVVGSCQGGRIRAINKSFF